MPKIQTWQGLQTLLFQVSGKISMFFNFRIIYIHLFFVYKQVHVLFINTYIFLESADEYLEDLYLNFQRHPRRFTVLNFRTTNNNHKRKGDENKQYLLNLLARMNKRRGTLLDQLTGFDHLEHPHIRLGQVQLIHRQKYH